jgi:hypothetical protein
VAIPVSSPQDGEECGLMSDPNDTDIVSRLMDYEDGNLSQEETIALFQALVNSGMAWTLQGSYGRTAQDMLKAGLIHR